MAESEYAAFEKDVAPSGSELSQLVKLIHDLEEAELDMISAEQEFKQKQERVRGLSQHDIPTMMTEIGLSEFKLADGRKVTVGKKIRCSIPKANYPEAMKFLEENGSGGLIKRTITVGFGRDSEETAHELAERLSETYDVKEARKVEPMTITAHIREQLTNGVAFPMELFGAYEQRFTKVGK